MATKCIASDLTPEEYKRFKIWCLENDLTMSQFFDINAREAISGMWHNKR